MRLRNYQKELYELSKGSDNVLLQADTGAGKTRILAKIAIENDYVICTAHTNLLLKQISKEFALLNVAHDIIATKYTKRQCVLEHRYYNIDKSLLRKCNTYVCSIDSLLSRYRKSTLPLNRGENWVILVDEAHHMLDKNKWGKLLTVFPNARVVGVTATPCRLDGESLSIDKGGVFHRLEQAHELKKDSVRTLIKKGHLSDFKCYSLPERIDSGVLKLGSNDYTYASLLDETKAVMYSMAGDAVKHYKRLATGRQAVVFCINIDIAVKTARYFRRSAINAACIHSKMSSVDIHRVFELFKAKQIQVLCNVDMIGEGIDVPNIDALIMLRKTASLSLYRQWVGRALRPSHEHDEALIIDHVGNIRTHGLPDRHIDWCIDGVYTDAKSNLMPCPECYLLIKAWVAECPECGHKTGRSLDAEGRVDMQYIDYNLVEMKRDKVIREHNFNNVLNIKKEQSNSIIHKSINKLKDWFAKVLLAHGVSIPELNYFFTEIYWHDEFWLKNFTIKDIDKNENKCIKGYKKWLKSK